MTDIIELTEAEIAIHDALLKKWARFPVKYLRELVIELKSARTENDRWRKWYFDTFQGEASDG